MNGKINRQLWFWSGGIIALGLFLYLLGNILLPFVVGMAVAYFLDPVVDALEERGISRSLAVLGILVLFFAVVVFGLLLLLPLLQDQFLAFLERLPHYVAFLRDLVAPYLEIMREGFKDVDVEQFGSAASGYATSLTSWAGEAISKLWSGGLALLNLLSLIFITPVAAFYLLRDWDVIVAHINGWLPRDHANTIRTQFGLIDETLSGFVRGVFLVCLVLAGFYGFFLSLIGLEFGLMVGIFSGLISFVPYVGAAIGFVVGTSMALMQFSEMLPVILVAATFLTGQTAESYLLTPNLVGDRIGLHPAWILFALLAFASLFGFVGILLAVPLAAVIGVLSRFAIDRYLESSYYRGAGDGGGGQA